MVKVYYAEDVSFWKESILFAHMEQIEEERRKIWEHREKSNDRARSLGAGLLQHYALCDYLNLPWEKTPPFRTCQGQWGKPYLAEYPDVYFNLSHSGRYVCCAVSEQETGVDIQEHRSGRKGIARRFFTAEDNQLLQSLDENRAQDMFFRIWSIRESYIKLTGRGIGQGLASFQIDWKSSALREQGEAAAYFVENNELPGYSLCVCSRQENMKPDWMKAELADRKAQENTEF